MASTNNTRQNAITAFLEKQSWANAHREALTADASSRTYERLTQAGKRALLMNAPPNAESSFCPPDADEKERKALGYNAEARLAGPNLHAFAQVAATLRGAGLSAPEIYAYDPDLGVALIEDLGDNLFVAAVQEGIGETLLYENAVDVLIALRGADPSPPDTADYKMMAYDETALLAEVALVTDWYWPFIKGSPAPEEEKQAFQALWKDILKTLEAPKAIVLRDFHAENLLWLPERDGVRKVGLIDFQDGLIGSYAYDLVSILEDARRDVSQDLAEAMVNRYCDRARNFPGFTESQMRREFAIMGAQRNAKILGIFARLINRDGKPRYGDFLPRVEAHFRRNLHHEALQDVKAFFAKHFPDLAL